MPTVKHNLPVGALRWPLDRAATEFRVDRQTLAQRLKKLGHEPAEGGAYSTQQILTAVSDGGIREARQRQIEQDTAKSKEMTEFYRRRNARFDGALYDAERVDSLVTAVLTESKQIILGSSLSPDEQDRLLIKLGEMVSGLPIIAEDQRREAK